MDKLCRAGTAVARMLQIRSKFLSWNGARLGEDTLQYLENAWITPDIRVSMNPLTMSASIPFSKSYANRQ